jgi:hypothetical protein
MDENGFGNQLRLIHNNINAAIIAATDITTTAMDAYTAHGENIRAAALKLGNESGVPMERILADYRRGRRLTSMEPDIRHALETNNVTVEQVDVIAKGCISLDNDEKTTVQKEMLSIAKNSTSSKDFAKQAGIVITKVAPRTIGKRQAESAARRRAGFHFDPVGRDSVFTMSGPTNDLVELHHVLTTAARRVHDRGNPESVLPTELYDVALDLFTKNVKFSSGQPTMVITVNAETLLGLDNQPARVIDGDALTPEETAQFLMNGILKGIILDNNDQPIGMIDLNHGRSERFAATDQRLVIHALSHGCATTGCANPIREGHVDHIQPWNLGGKTDIINLQALCTWCHIRKTATENKKCA